MAEGRALSWWADSAPDRYFTVPVTIHGRVFDFVADHGSNGTVITSSTIDSARLPHQFANATRVDTLVRRSGDEPVRDTSAAINITRGDTTFQYWGDLDPIEIDSLSVGRTSQAHVLIATEAAPNSLGQFGGLVGRDILSQFDLEFNAPAQRIRIYGRPPSDQISRSTWLPADIRAPDCVPAVLLSHAAIDTTQLDSADMVEIHTDPGARRIYEQSELKLPLMVDDKPVDALFDSGMDVSIMNWAQARVLGIDRHDPRLVPMRAGRMNMFSFQSGRLNADDSLAVVRDAEPNYRVGGITMRIGKHELPRDSVVISDLTFADFPGFRSTPLMLVGLRAFKHLVLYMSYSTRRVCIGDSYQ